MHAESLVVLEGVESLEHLAPLSTLDLQELAFGGALSFGFKV